MKISDLLQNEGLREKEFPITQHKIFLAHAASSPLPRRVTSAMSSYIRRASSEGQWDYICSDAEKEARKYAAAILGADEEEIAFVSSTSMGLSLVASGLMWQTGDNVVLADGDFPSNVYPWLNLENRGVKTKFIPRNNDGSVRLQDVINTIDEHTRLVSLSTVNYLTGFKIDVSSIGEYLQKKGILFCIDAIQSLGALPIDTTYIDFLAAGAHKWLLGPKGIGLLYVKKRNIDQIIPALAGWKCVQSSHNYITYNLRFLNEAKRFEPGDTNSVGVTGLRAALELLLEFKIERISDRLVKLTGLIRSMLVDKGYNVLNSANYHEPSGITSFYGDLDMIKLRNELDAHGFVVSLRDRFDGGKCIRVSPHFYNTEKEITRFLAAIPDISTKKISKSSSL